jgi:hypothetical protein
MLEHKGYRELDLLGPRGLWDFAFRIKRLGAKVSPRGSSVHLDDWMLQGSDIYNVPSLTIADRKRLVNELCSSKLVIDIVKRRKPMASPLNAMVARHVAITETVKRRAATRDDSQRVPRNKPRLSSPRPARSDIDATDETLLERCTIEWKKRPSSRRRDATFITPDGREFRSKVTALAHMRRK